MKFLLPISFLLIAGVLFFVVIDPTYKDVSSLRDDVNTYNLALDNVTQLQKTMDSLVGSYKNIKQEDKDRLNSLLPNTVNNIKFILEVEHIASLHNMPIKNIKFEAEKPASSTGSAGNTVVVNGLDDSRPYGVFPIEFGTDGDYGTFVSFLKDLEYNLRLVDVKSVSFTVPPLPVTQVAGFDPNILSYTLKVDTYWLK